MIIISLNSLFLKFNFLKKSLINLKKGTYKLTGRSKKGFLVSYKKNKTSYNKMFYFIDFWRRLNKFGYILLICKLSHRTGFVSLICYLNGIITYSLIVENIKIGSKIYSGDFLDKNYINKFCIEGSTIPIKFMPIGTVVSAIEFWVEKGAQICRAAGTGAIILYQTENYVTLKLRSGWKINILKNCLVTKGFISNSVNNSIRLFKAGNNVNLGIKPTVRGVAMNSVDHPHGGGRGKSAPKKNPLSPWGKATRNKITSKKIGIWFKFKKKINEKLVI